MMKRFASVLVALILVVGVFGAVTASASTIAELQAMIAQLQAQLASLSGGTSTSAGATTFTKTLSVGSRGDEVTALQEFLVSEGYGDFAATGYYGALTKAAVIKFQKAKGISGTGTVGPLTRAALNEAQTPVSIPTQEGTSTTGTTGSTVSGLDQTDGSVTVSLSPAVSTSQTLKKGDTKDIYAVKFQAIGGKVAINRVDVDFTVRPWLIASQLVLKDSSGTVLATKSLSSAADATEIVAGSDYAVRFDGLNVVVTPGTDTTLVVGISIPANNSFVGTSGYTSVGVAVKTGGIRSINGKGYSDSLGLASTFAVGQTSVNTLTMSATGNTADLTVTTAPTSPLTGKVNINSTGSDKTMVPLAVYRFRSSNQASTLNTLVFNIATDPDHTSDLTTSMKNFQLTDGTTKYGAASVSTGVVTFSSLNIALAQDVVKDLTLVADITASSSEWAASSTLDVSGTVATDANYNTPTYGGGTFAAGTDVTGGNLTFTSNAMSASNFAVSVGEGVVDSTVANSAVKVKYGVSYSFTLTNNGTNNLFVSKLPGVFVSTSTLVASVAGNVATTSLTEIAPLAALNGDTTGAYVIPAGGSRSFTLNGVIGKVTPATTAQSLTISAINYGTTAAAPTGASISAGIESLYKSITL